MCGEKKFIFSLFFEKLSVLEKVEQSPFISGNRLDDSNLPNKLQKKSSLRTACCVLQD